MRKIWFRAIGLDGKWYFGDLRHNGNSMRIEWETTDWSNPPMGKIIKHGKNVKRETVGQFTGLKDIDGVSIFEGDILKVWEQDEHIPERDSGGGVIGFNRLDGFSQLGVVSFKRAWYIYETKKHLEGREEQICAPLDFTYNLAVIGNIYDNPELLK